MVTLFALLSAASALMDARWEEVRSVPGTLEVGLEAPLCVTEVPGDTVVRARCPGDGRRWALLLPEGGAALVEGAFSQPTPDAEGWNRYPLAPASLGTWAWPAGCEVQARRVASTSWTLARAEREAGEEAALAKRVEADPEARAWLAQEGDWRNRWLAWRPPGPWPVAWSFPVPEGAEPVPLSLGGEPTTTWWRSSAPNLEIVGPRRIRVVARRLGPRRPLCLQVDGGPLSCDVSEDRTEVVLDSGPSRVPVDLDGEPLGQQVEWRVLVGPGRHSLVLDGPALVRASAALPLDGLGKEPVSTTVLGRPQAEPVETMSLRPLFAGSALLLLGPERARSVERSVARWLDPSEAEGLPVVDSDGRVHLWLDPSPGSICAVTLGQDRWWATPSRSVNRFLWTGPEPAPAVQPSVEGCTMRVRAEVPPDRTAQGAEAMTWYPADRAVRFDVPDSPSITLFVTVPHETPGPFTVRAVRAGTVETFRLRLLPWPEPARRTEDGRAFSAPMAIPLEAVVGPLEVEAPGGLVRVSAAGPAEEAATQPTPEPPGDAAPPQIPTIDDLRNLSRAVASATRDPERASALLARADLLLALGQPRLGWSDLARALLIRPGLADARALGLAVKREEGRLAWGSGRWVPEDAAWVPDASLVLPAARGDHVAVAEALAASGLDPCERWRRAILEGQILTPDQRTRAYTDALAREPEETHPWLGPVRALSRWERIHQVRGDGLPAPGLVLTTPHDAIEDALWPDAWPQAVSLPEGWELFLPAGSQPREVRVRARSARIEPLAGVTVEARAPDGRIVSDIQVDSWGTPGVLRLPPGQAFALRARPSDGISVECLLPQGVRPMPGRAWTLRANGVATFEVLGPTTLGLVVARDGAPTVVDLTVEGASGCFEKRFTVDGVADLRVPIRLSGPLEVALRTLDPVRFQVRARVPAAESVPVGADLAALRTPSLRLPEVPPAPASADLSSARPVGRPLVSSGVRVAVRTGEDQPDDAPATASRTSLQALLATRPGQAPLWVEGRIGGDRAAQGSYAFASAGIDARLAARRAHTWLLLDLDAVTGVTGAPLSATHARTRLRWDVPLRRRFTLLAAAEGDVRLGSGAPEAPTWHWSAYKAAHPLALGPALEFRWSPGPWLRLTGWTDATSNPTPTSLDRARIGGRLELGAPSLWLRAGASLDHRFADSERAFPYDSPEWRLEGCTWIWVRRGLGMRLGASLVWQPYWDAVLGGASVLVLGSRDRGIGDLRPSSLAFPHAAGWGAERAAARSLEGR